MRIILWALLLVVVAWVFAVLGVPLFVRLFSSYEVPLSWSALVEWANTQAAFVFGWVDARPVVVVILLPSICVLALWKG